MRLDIPLKRVLLLGGSGLLGNALERIFIGAGLEVIAPASDACDVRDLPVLRQHTRDAEPDLILNATALSSVDQAEKEPDLTYAVNTLGAHNAAMAAADADLPLLHISSDYVFEGNTREPYHEYHPTGVPPNHYGRSKLHAELLVREAWPQHFIVRVAALFGVGRKNFVSWVLDEADPARPLTIVHDRFTTPTWTDDLARQLLVLARTPYYGTYHATGLGETNWYYLAHSALLLAGLDPDGIKPVADVELTSLARRARYTALSNHLLRLRGICTMLPWREALAAYIDQRRAETNGGPA